MRNRFDRQLLELNNELIEMGGLIEQAIEMGISALIKQDVEKAVQAMAFDEEVDQILYRGNGDNNVDIRDFCRLYFMHSI